MVAAGDPVVRYLRPDDDLWSATLTSLPHDIYHLPEYAALDARLWSGRARGYLYSEGERRMLLPLVIREVPDCELSDASSPYGYPGPVSNASSADYSFWRRATEALTRSLRCKGIVALFARTHPLLPPCYDALSAAGALVKHGETVSVDLRKSRGEIWRATRRSHRRAIEHARRSGMRVVIDDWGFLEQFIETYHATMVRVGASARYLYGPEHFEELRETFPGRLHLASAIVSGEYVGGQLFFFNGGLANAHLSGTQASSAARGASKLIDDEVRWWVQARGGREYHLGGGLGGRSDDLYAYKAGFSDRTLPFFTWRVVTNEPAYEALVAKGGPRTRPGGPHEYFPAYRGNDTGQPRGR